MQSWSKRYTKMAQYSFVSNYRLLCDYVMLAFVMIIFWVSSHCCVNKH